MMVARFAGAGLALLAFSITIIAGLAVQNPVEVVLSRGLIALFLFCMIGLVLGWVAQWVIREHVQENERDLWAQTAGDSTDAVNEPRPVRTPKPGSTRMPLPDGVREG